MDATSRDAREALPGWAWIWAGGAAVVGAPLWFLLTAAVIQLTPRLGGWDEATSTGVDALDAPPWWRVWSIGGAWGGVGLVLLLAGVATLVGIGAVGGRIAALRARSARAALDAEIDRDAVLRGVTLELKEVSAYDPRLDDTGALPFASPGARLVAAGCDLALLAIPFPLLPLLGIAVTSGGAWSVLTGHVSPAVPPLVAGCLAVFVVVLAVQHVLVARSGQTIGKKLLGLRVVHADGRPAGFGTAVVLRWWVWALVLGIVPVVGWVVGPLLDVVLLFGRDHRTLHDLIAGTVVVDVR